MGRILTITNSEENQSNYRKRAISREIVVGPNTIKFITIAIFAILAIVFLSQSTAGANRSVKVRQLTDEKSNLELTKERLEVESSRLQSLSEVDKNITKPSLEPVGEVGHLSN